MNEVVIPILNKDYKVIFTCGTPEDIKKVMKKHKFPLDQLDEAYFNGRGVCFYFPGLPPLIAMPRAPKTNEEIATLAHEAVHAVNDIFEKIGEERGGEVFAHSVSAIVEIVLEEYKKRGKKKNARGTTSNTTSKAAI